MWKNKKQTSKIIRDKQFRDGKRRWGRENKKGVHLDLDWLDIPAFNAYL